MTIVSAAGDPKIKGEAGLSIVADCLVSDTDPVADSAVRAARGVGRRIRTRRGDARRYRDARCASGKSLLPWTPSADDAGNAARVVGSVDRSGDRAMAGAAGGRCERMSPADC